MHDFYWKGHASVVIDGQYGSTGKGLLAGYLAKQSSLPQGHVTHTTNAAPNAGHTTQWWDVDGNDQRTEMKKIVTYHLPTGGVLRGELCYINAGAVVDVPMLMKEIEEATATVGKTIHVQIHPHAAMLLPEDREAEAAPGSSAEAISSTRKGVGSAISRKVMRSADTMADWKKHYGEHALRVHTQSFNSSLKHGHSISIEVPQGISLGLNHSGFYPFCTSREVSVAQAMSDAGIHPKFLGFTALSMRTFPIRVGSLPGSTSGPYFFDQREIDWSDLDLEPELTTVTKRPRRIFTWSREQYRQALIKAQPEIVFLNFVNYYRSVKQLDQQLAGMKEDHGLTGIDPTIIYGLGPCIEDVYDSYDKAAARITERKVGSENSPV
jgi:adenylosuccinate synthase